MTKATTQIEAWRRLYNDAYRQEAANFANDSFDGWISTYDQQPLPTGHMLEWRADVTRLLLAGRPRRVLDIGCGSGMLTDAVLRSGAGYWGTDVASEAIDSLRRALGSRSASVTLRCQAAHDFTRVPRKHFDAVVLNSVIQYFPDRRYLEEVLSGAAETLTPGGRIILGDVRDQRTLRAFTMAAWALHVDDVHDSQQLHRRVEGTLSRNQELLFDPVYFAGLAGFSAIEILAKDGRSHNEITRHRYNVVLHKANPDADFADVPGDDYHGPQELEIRLRASRAPLRLVNVPNARLLGEWHALQAADLGKPIEAIRECLADGHPGNGVDPHELRRLAARFDYRVRVMPSPSGWHLFDLLMTPSEVDPDVASGTFST